MSNMMLLMFCPVELFTVRVFDIRWMMVQMLDLECIGQSDRENNCSKRREEERRTSSIGEEAHIVCVCVDDIWVVAVVAQAVVAA
mmetsp:Transcript_12519/g.30232  ORF Transcript_12519/g.30232 Transcript_12519/m.30232 type:complete len:85 (+) Transcript_12519:818-1072(+)